ncbi:MAG: YihA family ribosome biogenesis GTP-binding protein [Gammaproteobacteria bacterium]|nr:YihA family ribosome biogenesis GTP-binding protein [Gammaproteobacteria bacterium]
MVNPYQKAYFLLSVADVKQLPPDEGYEVAIVGRSNAGKSSTLNKLTNLKGLARVSKTPGRTRLVNIFVIDDTRRLADLPGYGYAKAPRREREAWQKTVDLYLRGRTCLKGVLLVMDVRHAFKELDLLLLDFCSQLDIPVHILLNKADKLTQAEAYQVIKKAKSILTHYDNSVTLQPFSATKGTGLKALHMQLNQWYGFKEGELTHDKKTITKKDSPRKSKPKSHRS